MPDFKDIFYFMTPELWAMYFLLWVIPSFVITFRACWNHPYDDFTVTDLVVCVGSSLTLGWIGVLLYYGPSIIIKKNPKNK